MTKINPQIFRAYDVRGIAMSSADYPLADLDEEAMYLLGKGIGSYLIVNEGRKVAIGRDVRLTGEVFSKAFIKGLLSVGCDVIDFGMVTSPLIYYAVCKYDLDGGVVITASHNPKEYSGLKIVGKAAHSICGEKLQIIRKQIENSQFLISKTQGEILDTPNLFADYIEDLKQKFTFKKPLKIAIDSGNGAAGPYAGILLRALGADVIELYNEPDGNFPNHEANPEYEKNVTELMDLCKNNEIDVGFAFDGDGDRLGVVDDKGKLQTSDNILIFLSRDLLSKYPRAKVVFDVKCSLNLKNEINKLGGHCCVSPTGHSFIETRMKEEKALLGGEVSGHLFFGEDYYGFDDALFGAAKIAYILSTQNQNLSSLLSDIPNTHTTPEIKVPCSDESKFEVVDRLKEYFLNTYDDCLTLDGVRVNFSETEWGIVRCSNTSPNLTLRFEASSKEQLKEIQKIFAKAMSPHQEISGDWLKEFLFE